MELLVSLPVSRCTLGGCLRSGKFFYTFQCSVLGFYPILGGRASDRRLSASFADFSPSFLSFDIIFPTFVPWGVQLLFENYLDIFYPLDHVPDPICLRCYAPDFSVCSFNDLKWL